ncbi:MAG: hypothetical protein ABI076_07730, partial [Acidobacteriaceae bacterium]
RSGSPEARMTVTDSMLTGIDDRGTLFMNQGFPPRYFSTRACLESPRRSNGAARAAAPMLRASFD